MGADDEKPSSETTYFMVADVKYRREIKPSKLYPMNLGDIFRELLISHNRVIITFDKRLGFFLAFKSTGRPPVVVMRSIMEVRTLIEALKVEKCTFSLKQSISSKDFAAVSDLFDSHTVFMFEQIRNLKTPFADELFFTGFDDVSNPAAHPKSFSLRHIINSALNLPSPPISKINNTLTNEVHLCANSGYGTFVCYVGRQTFRDVVFRLVFATINELNDFLAAFKRHAPSKSIMKFDICHSITLEHLDILQDNLPPDQFRAERALRDQINETAKAHKDAKRATKNPLDRESPAESSSENPDDTDESIEDIKNIIKNAIVMIENALQMERQAASLNLAFSQSGGGISITVPPRQSMPKPVPELGVVRFVRPMPQWQGVPMMYANDRYAFLTQPHQSLFDFPNVPEGVAISIPIHDQRAWPTSNDSCAAHRNPEPPQQSPAASSSQTLPQSIASYDRSFYEQIILASLFAEKNENLRQFLGFFGMRR